MEKKNSTQQEATLYFHYISTVFNKQLTRAGDMHECLFVNPKAKGNRTQCLQALLIYEDCKRQHQVCTSEKCT